MERATRGIASPTRGALAALVVLVSTSCAEERPRRDDRAVSEHAHVSYGATMVDVGRRFELVGRAGAAGRFDFASYELGELDELFEETLPHAALPKEGRTDELPMMLRTFRESSLRDLARAIDARDPSAFVAAFTRTAAACNGCHLASDHGFIEIPLSPGRSVPTLDPVVAPAAR